jgi:ribosomal protein L11 methyltransferase
MDKRFLEICWTTFIPQEESEILISYLLEIGFEAFHEDEFVFRAYIDSNLFNNEVLKDELKRISISSNIHDYTICELPEKNWNEEWEKNFSPVLILDQITIRAPFHDIEMRTPYEIIIEPKMSFGTGHHETTSGMLEMMLRLDFKEKKVIDMGAGTGILAVFAEKLGATEVVAIDHDYVCIENSEQILGLNHCINIKVLHGDSNLLSELNADIILANINRNVLLNDIKTYSASLSMNGFLLLSGFYEDDFSLIDSECIQNGLKLHDQLKKNNWMICIYKLS